MKTVNRMAVVHDELCNGCGACSRVCPVIAIDFKKAEVGRKAFVDIEICQGCNICVSRCPQKAMTLEPRSEFKNIGISDIVVDKAIEELCEAAHMYPEQVVCFCHRVQAKEIAKAVLLGAKTPEDVSRMTGARAGCGVLCITGVIRLLQAAGVELAKAPGNQWYGKMATIWEIPEAVMEKYGKQYYLKDDQEYMKKMFPGGDK